MNSIKKIYFVKAGHVTLLFAVCISLFLSSCSRDEQQTLGLEGEKMGTSYHLTVHDVPETTNLVDLQQDVEILMNDIDNTFSTYKDDSELMRLNRGEVNQWQEVSPAMAKVMSMSLQVFAASDGAFEITVSPLVELWGFGATEKLAYIPTDEEILPLLERVGSENIELDMESLRLRKTAAVEIDLSAIAKGYAVDSLANLFDKYGLQNYLVEVGGEARTNGKSPRGDDWKLGIEVPEPMAIDGRKVHSAVTLAGMSIATSGDYRNYFEINGRRYSHTINPRNGKPVDHDLASVTVIAETAAAADAWATALNVLGVEKGVEMAEREGLAAFFISRKGSEGYTINQTTSFSGYLTD